MCVSLTMTYFGRTVDGLNNIYADNLEAQNALIGNVAFEDVTTNDISAASLTVSGASSLNTLTVSGASTTGALTSSGAIAGTTLTASGAVTGASVTASGAVTAASVSGGTMTGSTLTLSGNLVTTAVTATGPLVFTTAAVMRLNTVDGTDNGFISICGGGDIGPWRGGRIIVRGNEAANPGKVQILAGDTGRIEFGANNDTLRGTVEQDGAWTMTATTPTTSSTTGALRISGGFSTSLTTDASSATNGGTFTTPGGAAIGKSLWVGTTLNVAGTLTGVSASFSGSLDAGQANFTGLVFTGGTVFIRQSTVDGADINSISLCGGGAANSSRGGRIVVRGNEAASAGKVQIWAGDAGGGIELGTTGDTVRMTVEQDGTVTMTSATPTTSSSTGALRISGGFSTSLTTDATSATNGGTFTTPGGAAIAKSLWVGTTLNVAGTLTGTTAVFTTVTISGTFTAAIFNATNYIQLKNCSITSNSNDMYINGNGGLITLRPNNTANYTLTANTTNVQITDGSGSVRTTITNGGDIACLSVNATGTLVSGTTITAGTNMIVNNILSLKNTSLTSTGNDLVLNGNVGAVQIRPNNNANNALYVNPTNIQITNSSGVVKTTISSGGAIACDSVTTTGNLTAAQFVGGVSGSWTPVIQSDTTITYTFRQGNYYKLGNIVVIFAALATTGALNIGAGADMALLGLPFVNSASIIQLGTCILSFFDLPASTDFVTPFVPAGANWFNFAASRDNLAFPLLKVPTTAATRSMFVQITMYT